MLVTGCIYRIYSQEGNCCYIGQTTKKCRNERYRQHIYEFVKERYYYSSFEVLQYSDHKFEIVEDNIPLQDLKEREKYYIHHFDNIVNKYSIN